MDVLPETRAGLLSKGARCRTRLRDARTCAETSELLLRQQVERRAEADCRACLRSCRLASCLPLLLRAAARIYGYRTHTHTHTLSVSETV